MELEKYAHSLPRCAVVLGAVTLLVAGCQQGSSTPSQSSSQPASTSASTSEGSSGASHHMEGGISQADPLPQGDQHPAELRPQELYALGEKSVFAIEGQRPDDFVVSATGFLVDKEGGMGVTNAHVVEGLSAISGRFNTGEKGALHVIASDPCTDLAVVHFSSALPKQTEALIFGNSADVKPGDSVTVLGFPGTATQNSAEQKLLITSGLVNAIKVPARGPGLPEYKDTIQHGATVNPGNSGGPLLDHHGRIVGINTLTYLGSQNAPAQGQFYSISSDSAKREIVDKLLKGDSPNNMGWAVEEYYPGYFAALDSTRGPALDAQLARQGVKGGLYVKGVTAGAGASKAGIKPGMLLTRLQNTSVATIAKMCDITESILPGATAVVDGLNLLSDPAKFDQQFHVEFVVPGKH
ncbi:S1-C subfamily serine protease [Arthrobacter globiformis]|uniref:S1C family serine protease n=1 Tax=Arthrobacter globiformis TaxID=1665 RepID=UPI0027885BB4|nr:S1C family serine protease [Arthrobacter globiformis]MDQ1058389.1 S1-C subfamily serine protease [Arthrobacter globiformis]